MQIFFQLTYKAIQRKMTYRAAIIAGLATNIFFGVIRAAVMVALYESRTDVAGMSLQDAITFTGLSQATIGTLNMFSWFNVVWSVYSGEVASDLLKPINYMLMWLTHDLGRTLVELLFRGIPIMLVYVLMFGISTPESASQWLFVLVSLSLAWIISFGWRFLANLSAFWTPNAAGIVRFVFIISWFLSGFMMPLRFFPDWFVRLCYLTPFPHTVNTIIEIYLGLLQGEDLIRAFLAQAVWALVLILAGQVMMGYGIRKLVIHGG
jgi:ABC-2 type transport system permease protein